SGCSSSFFKPPLKPQPTRLSATPCSLSGV
ncbi:mCG57148, isoform CRA_b, partial [Mus musculus]